MFMEAGIVGGNMMMRAGNRIRRTGNGVGVPNPIGVGIGADISG
jgi:hypothetical protein